MEHIRLSLGSLQDVVKTQFNYNETLRLLQFIVNYIELTEISEYSRKYNLNDKTIRNRIKNKKIPTIKISNTVFIIEKLMID